MSARRVAPRRAAITAAIALAADQASKGLVRANLEPGESRDLIAGVDLVRVGNEGIAFGLFDGTGTAIIVAAAAGFGLLLAYFLLSSDEAGLWLPIGLLAGGALGNLIDRLREGAVTDFIDPPNWPAFNVADIEITAGVILLLAIYFRPGSGGGGAPAADEPRGREPGAGADGNA